MADGHAEIRLSAAQKIGNVAGLRGVGRKIACGHAQRRGAQLYRPIAQRQNGKDNDKRRGYPVGRPLGIRAGEKAALHIQRQIQRFAIFQRRCQRAVQHCGLRAQIQIILNHIAAIAAEERRLAVILLWKHNRKGVVLNGVFPLGTQKRHVQRLHAVGLGDKIAQRIRDGKGAASGKAGVAGEPQARNTVLGIRFCVIAGNLGFFCARAKRKMKLLLGRLQIQRQRLRNAA